MFSYQKPEALKAVGDGRTIKIIVPTELASVVANLEFVGEMVGTQGADQIDKSLKQKPVVIKKDPCCK